MQYASKEQLATEVNNGVPGYVEEHGPFMDLAFNQDHISTKRIRERKENMELGLVEIPKIGHHVKYVSNFEKPGEHPDMMVYPEMNLFHLAGILERVDDVACEGRKVGLTIGIYLVKNPNGPRLYNLRRG